MAADNQNVNEVSRVSAHSYYKGSFYSDNDIRVDGTFEGDILTKGAGIPAEELDGRVVKRYPEIRELIYTFFKEHGTVDSALVGDCKVLGEWYFVPERLVKPRLGADMALIF